jgi:hypothetical protein
MAAPQVSLLTLRTSVREHLDEPSAVFWSDARLNRIINRAKDEIWLEVRKLKRGYFEIERTSLDGAVTILGTSYATSGFAIVAGTATYTLPPDFAELTLMECLTSGYEWVRFVLMPKQHTAFRTALTLTVNQTPTIIYADIEGERTLRIAPKSNMALDVRLTYVRILPDLSLDADALEMPHPLYIAVEELAAKRAQMQDRDGTNTWWAAEATASVTRFLGAHRRQSQDIDMVESVEY